MPPKSSCLWWWLLVNENSKFDLISQSINTFSFQHFFKHFQCLVFQRKTAYFCVNILRLASLSIQITFSLGSVYLHNSKPTISSTGKDQEEDTGRTLYQVTPQTTTCYSCCFPPKLPLLEPRWSSLLPSLIILPITTNVKAFHDLLKLWLSAVTEWVPVILWRGSLSRPRVEVMVWAGRSSRGTNEGPGCDAGCPGVPGCRACGSSTTPWWSVPETAGTDGRRRRRTPAGSPPRMCQRWRRRQRHVLRPDLGARTDETTD